MPECNDIKTFSVILPDYVGLKKVTFIQKSKNCIWTIHLFSRKKNNLKRQILLPKKAKWQPWNRGEDN
jgi:hypothetical protein